MYKNISFLIFEWNVASITNGAYLALQFTSFVNKVYLALILPVLQSWPSFVWKLKPRSRFRKEADPSSNYMYRMQVNLFWLSHNGYSKSRWTIKHTWTYTLCPRSLGQFLYSNLLCKMSQDIKGVGVGLCHTLAQFWLIRFKVEVVLH